MALRDKLESLPARPGVYLFKDVGGRVIYVGKARLLRDRVRSYFQAGRPLELHKLRLVEEIQEIARIGQPVSVLVRGFDLLPSRVIENVQVTFARETAEATIQATFVEVRQVTLSFAPVEQDADLVAMGSQAQATIGLF